MKTCERCGTNNVIKSNTEFYNLYPANNTPRTQDRRKCHRIVMSDLKPNTDVFYFASQSGSVKDRDSAYGQLSNSGVTRTDSQGNAIFYLQCAGVYRTPEGRIYPRHFHWVYWTEKGWGRRIYTKKWFCPVSKAYVRNAIRTGSHLIIDALPADYYNKRHISGAINIPHNKPIDESLLGKDKTRPIIIYCWSPECSAAEHLNSRLEKLGWLNTYHYEEGISNW